MDKKKYKLTHETKKVDGRTLYRIQALRDFGSVKKGDFGGYIASERYYRHAFEHYERSRKSVHGTH